MDSDDCSISTDDASAVATDHSLSSSGGALCSSSGASCSSGGASGSSSGAFGSSSGASGSSASSPCYKSQSPSIKRDRCAEREKALAQEKSKHIKLESVATRHQTNWVDHRIPCIFLYLGKELMNGKLDQTAALCGINPASLYDWTSVSRQVRYNYCCKWFRPVSEASWGAIKKKLPPTIADQFLVPDEYQIERCCLAPYEKFCDDKPRQRVITDFTDWKTQSDVQTLRGAVTKGSAVRAYGVSTTALSHGHKPTCRIPTIDLCSDDDAPPVPIDCRVKYRDVTLWLYSFLRCHWNKGQVFGRGMLLTHLCANFGPGSGHPMADVFWTGNAEVDRRRLLVWLDRSLERIGWTTRCKTVCQKVPYNWRIIAVDAARDIRGGLSACTRVVFFDEAFLRFCPEDKQVAAPRGSVRVGGILAADDKDGCTCGISAELYSNEVLPPFLIMKATKDGNLYKHWKDHHTTGIVHAFICFQLSHWCDADMWIQYLEYLITLYPGQLIGVVADKAPTHTCKVSRHGAGVRARSAGQECGLGVRACM